MKIKKIAKVIVPCGHLCDKSVIKTDLFAQEHKALDSMKAKGGLRDAFICPEGYYWLTADYAQQEIRLLGNFANEPNYYKPILEGKDIHNYVAKQMFGFEDPSHRTKVKTLNFACLTDNSFISTDSGLKRPSQLLPTDKLYDRYGNLQLYSMLPFKGETIEVEYQNGVVETYKYDHKVLCWGEGFLWKKVCDLTKNDNVVLPNHINAVRRDWIVNKDDYYKYKIKSDIKWNLSDYRFAYLIGLILGHGLINKKYEISFIVNNDCYLTVIDYLNQLGLDYSVSEQTDKQRIIYISNRALGRVVCDFFGRTKTKHIADEVFQYYGTTEIKYLLAGLIDSDDQQNRATYQSTNLELIHGFASLCQIIGISPKLRVRYSNYKGNRVKFYELLLCTNELPILTKHGKSSNFKGNDVKQDASLVPLLDYNLIKPIKITNKGINTCYAIACENHEYLTINTISHNCNYGAGANTISDRLKIPIQEAQKLLDNFYNTMSNLTKWKKEITNEGRRKGIIYTLFGRPRLVYQYYRSSKTSDHAFGDRTCVNSPIQGCSPLDGYLTLKDSVKVMGDCLCRQQEGRNGRLIIPSHRGEYEPLLVVFNTGDFAVVDINHKFVTGSLLDPKESRVRDGLTFKGRRSKILMEPRKRIRWNFSEYYFKSLSTLQPLLLLSIKRDREIKIDNKYIPACLFRLALSRRWFSLDYLQMIRIRSLASLFGYRCIYSPKKDKFRIVFSHRKSGKVKLIRAVLDEDTKVPVGTCTAVKGFHMYENQGIMNVNTGGDIIRLDHSKLVQLYKTDEEFRNNTCYACTVHDEVNLFVKKDYLYKAFDKLTKLMYFNIPQFKVPIVAEPGIGTDWGHIIDIKGAYSIDVDNKIHNKDLDKLYTELIKSL